MIRTGSFFIFKGIKSSDYDVLVEKQPDIVSPANHIEAVTIPGRSGSLYLETPTFESYTKSIDCALFSREHIDKLTVWLRGSGKLIFSNEKSRYYKATILNKIPLANVLRHFWRFTLVFECEPFKYNVNELDDIMELTAPNSFYGQGNVDSEPVIQVMGRGDIVLTVNDKTIYLNNVEDSVYLYSEMLSAFRYPGGGNVTNLTAGSFPLLNGAEGNNTVSWSGNVSKVIIEPRWRWI